ncbi:alpha/beta hydrolase [Rhodobacter sp. SY28-1]|uniref:alpha/beta hydrolase n=1 Tax=Rhodobacter sp. SY28-1 TaxID=2562317 RepID=UPI0010BFBBA9|nr:dienelactone hydrolase family protein [Rhodobacter sp. SY28-1]
MTLDVLHTGTALQKARVACVFLHGRGQSPEAMLDHVVQHLPGDVAWILPRAKGGSWYAARAIDPLTDTTRTELAASLTGLAAVMTDVRSQTFRPVVLAGFSQGACLSLEHTFTGASPADAVLAFTGCRVGTTADQRPAALLRELPVYLSGADADPWIPVAAFAEAAAELALAGASLRSDIFPCRAHEVSPAERAMLATVLAALAEDRPVTMEAPR